MIPIPPAFRLSLLASLVLLAGCGDGKEAAGPAPARSLTEVSGDPNEVVATYSAGKITRGDIAEALSRRLSRLPQPVTEEARREVVRTVLERQVRIGLLYQEGVEQGLPQRPDVELRTRVTEERLLAEDWLDRHAARGARAADAEVEAEVARRLAARGEETRRFSHIFLRAPQSDPVARQKARATMETIRRELAAGRGFDELARAHSDSVTARAGGRVEWTPAAPLHHSIRSVVFSLAEGQVSAPVETETGLHLFRVDGIRRPPAPDAAALRQTVRQQLDADAAQAAVEAARARAFDASGARIDARALARPLTPASAGTPVAQATGVDPITRGDFDVLRRAWASHREVPDEPFARLLLVNRVLAARRRAEPIDPALARRLEQARRFEVVAVRREELIAGIPTAATAEEEAKFYRENLENAPFLRELVVDLLFFPQQGESQAGVYSEGEKVSKQLRDGERFDRILEAASRRPGVVVRRNLSGGSLEGLQQESNRVADALGRMPVGEVSAPIYMDGERVAFGQAKPVVDGKGLLFLRLAEVRPFPLDAVRGRIREVLARQKEGAGVGEIQRRLNEKGQLKVLLPAG